MNRCLQVTCIALAAMFAVNVHAADIFWMGGTGNFTDPNYSDGPNTNLVPQEIDIIFLGNSGTVTDSVAGLGLYQKLRVGHDLAIPGGVGPATLIVNSGAQISLSAGGTTANASLIIGGGSGTAGSGVNGTLNIDGSGSSVTTGQLVQIGFGDNASANATVNITNGGSLVASAGNINLGERNAVGSGVPGHLNISGASSILTIAGSGADLNVGVRAASSYLQSEGTVTIADAITVGSNSTAIGSSFSVSGGSVTSRSISIGPAANNASGSITGNSVINVTTNNFNVGTGAAQGSSLLVADTADINIQATGTGQGNMFIGRDTSSNTTFTMTGGTIDTGRNFLLGNATGATGIVGNQSGGTITTTLNFTIGDTNGGSTYNLSGTGAVVANGQVVIGRQTTAANSGVMNQTGGSVTAALGITVGNAQDATNNPALLGTGIYNVSGGTVTANQTTGTALTIGAQGAGTFRVIGDDAVIDINGNATVNAGGGSQGTLAYQLKADDLFSMVDVSGIATFNAGAILAFDTSLATPTQTSYNLLTATDVIDGGLVFSGPAGWGFDIIAGGNGEILRAVQTGPVGVAGDYNGNGTVDAADYVLWRNGGPLQNEIATPGTVTQEDYDSWRARFGSTSGSGAGTSVNAGQVPEPAAAVLMLMGLVAAFSRRGSRS